MGYSIRLEDKNGAAVKVKPHQEGSIVAVGGLNYAEMTVTYNYSRFYYEYLDKDHGLRWLYGKSLGEVRQRLEDAIRSLGIGQSGNYWDATPGNAGHVLSVLYGWARQHPTAKFSGD